MSGLCLTPSALATKKIGLNRFFSSRFIHRVIHRNDPRKSRHFHGTACFTGPNCAENSRCGEACGKQ
jgi:hypothetical protein